MVTKRMPFWWRCIVILMGLQALVGAILLRSPLAMIGAIGFCIVMVRWSLVSVSANKNGILVNNIFRSTWVPWGRVQGWLIVGNGICLIQEEGRRPIQLSAVQSSIVSTERRYRALECIRKDLCSVRPEDSPPWM